MELGGGIGIHRRQERQGARMERWRSDGRVRRRAVFALALLAHAMLVGAMLRSHSSHEQSTLDATIETTIWLPPPAPRAVPRVLPPPRPTRLRSMPQPVVDPQAMRAPLLEARPIAQAAGTPEPPASAASQPLNLTLTRDQLRGVIAGVEADARTVARERARAVCAVAHRGRRQLLREGLARRRDRGALARRLLQDGADARCQGRPVQPWRRAAGQLQLGARIRDWRDARSPSCRRATARATCGSASWSSGVRPPERGRPGTGRRCRRR